MGIKEKVLLRRQKLKYLRVKYHDVKIYFRMTLKKVHRVIRQNIHLLVIISYWSQNMNNWLIPEGHMGIHCTFKVFIGLRFLK